MADASAADAHLGTDENLMLAVQRCQPPNALVLVHSPACSVSADDDGDAAHEAAALMSTGQLRHLQSPNLMCNPLQSQQMPAHRTGRPLSELRHATHTMQSMYHDCMTCHKLHPSKHCSDLPGGFGQAHSHFRAHFHRQCFPTCWLQLRAAACEPQIEAV